MDIKKQIKKEKIYKAEHFFRSGQEDKKLYEKTIFYVLKKIKENLEKFPGRYPAASSENLIYPMGDNEISEWTAGFWTGMIWLAYELTGSAYYKEAARRQLKDYAQRLTRRNILDHHDIGFLYILSAVADYKITKNPEARKIALEAADLLAARYLDGGGIIQVRDREGDKRGTFIIDCCMNIPLLYWAWEETGNEAYREKAYHHIQQTARYIVREDASTYHCFQVNGDTGEPLKGWTGQGYSDESCWARGQAWGIYGFAISAGYTKDQDCLETAKKLANYFLNRLPEDDISNWDLCFTGEDEQRDSSAAAIAVCGLLQLSDMLPEEDECKAVYHYSAVSILNRLCREYMTDQDVSNGILKHGVYCKDKGNGGFGDDECCIWGDYFFLEALTRLHHSWKMYW